VAKEDRSAIDGHQSGNGKDDRRAYHQQDACGYEIK
jgi:hypothetical protein